MTDEKKTVKLKEDELDKVAGGRRGDRKVRYCPYCERDTSALSDGMMYITIISENKDTMAVGYICDVCNRYYYEHAFTDKPIYPWDVK